MPRKGFSRFLPLSPTSKKIVQTATTSNSLRVPAFFASATHLFAFIFVVQHVRNATNEAPAIVLVALLITSAACALRFDGGSSMERLGFALLTPFGMHIALLYIME